MNLILKRILIAAGLLAFCIAVLAGVKSYGVWVITVIAVVLVIIGIVRKERSPGPESPDGVRKRDGEG